MAELSEDTLGTISLIKNGMSLTNIDKDILIEELINYVDAVQDEERARAERLKESGEIGTPFRIKKGYELLAEVLMFALAQAQSGKGDERHNQYNQDFERQAWMVTRQAVGEGFTLGQAMKKIMEIREMVDDEQAERELLGAINYLAMEIIYRRI